MNMLIFSLRTIVATLVLMTFSCSNEQPTISKIEGIYAYRLITGEIEVLRLRGDLTFRHELFKNQTAFEQGRDVLFHEEGAWHLDHSEIVMALSSIFDMDYPTKKKIDYLSRKCQV